MLSLLLLLLLLIAPAALAATLKRTVLITGGNRGIGLAAAKRLAATDEWNVVLACRSEQRALAAVKGFKKGAENVEVCVVDLADLSSVKQFASKWGKRPIDCLALNAGIQIGNPTIPLLTAQGLESTVGTNHVGHFLLMNLLLGNVEKSKAGRVVIVGSGVHNPEEAGGNVGSKATLGDLAGLKGGLTGNSCMVDGGKFDPDKAYKDSKLCNVITSAELARRLKKKGSKTTSNCMNPGLIPTTGLFREFNLLFVGVFTFLTRYVFKVAVSEEQGGERLAYMVASPELNGISGAYYSQTYLPKPPGYLPTPISAEAQDLKKASQLWALTEKLIKDNNK